MQQAVRDAERAWQAAQGRREVRDAESALESARMKERMSSAALRTLAGQLGTTVDAILAPEPPPIQAPQPPARTRVDAPLLKSEVLRMIRSFGDRRAREGDDLFEDDELPGSFLYSTGDARVGICVWGGGETRWSFSIFSAARIRSRPSLELYRFVSRWRTTAGIGAPYVIECDGEAAIMCERLFDPCQFVDGPGARTMIEATIDLIGEAAVTMSTALRATDDGGVPFTATGLGGLMALKSWWEVSDPRITEMARSSRP
ncbi:hypothetical protein [Actinomycetospora sp. NBRC 106378]|uniref:hypothetical protein n=1 Tax=Actinomycetospora sp. NBRC 106378 TaxID=3032208 RepID=UPI00255229F7|nr:hypothetical protein [Actinomycetospora sp. NBRC 106378]